MHWGAENTASGRQWWRCHGATAGAAALKEGSKNGIVCSSRSICKTEDRRPTTVTNDFADKTRRITPVSPSFSLVCIKKGCWIRGVFYRSARTKVHITSFAHLIWNICPRSPNVQRAPDGVLLLPKQTLLLIRSTHRATKPSDTT